MEMQTWNAFGNQRKQIICLITLLGTLIAMYGNSWAVLVVPYVLHIGVAFPMPVDHLDDVPMVSVGGNYISIKSNWLYLILYEYVYIITENNNGSSFFSVCVSKNDGNKKKQNAHKHSTPNYII